MATLAIPSVKKLVPDALREALLLTRAQAAAEARSSDQQARIREMVHAVDARLAVVDSLTAGDQIPAALELLRDAAVLTIRARMEVRDGASGSLPLGSARESRGDESDKTTEKAFRRLAAILEFDELPPPAAVVVPVTEPVSVHRHLAFDELSTDVALARRAEALATIRRLRSSIDTRSVSQIRGTRALRLVIAALLVGAFVWRAASAVAPQNIALDKPVQISSRRSNCPPASGEAGLPPSGAVDGSKTGAYDVCTNFEVRPWLTVDLQEVRRLSKAVVYYRGDCCWGQYDLPAVLELSEDGSNFIEVGRRETAYSNKDPWTVPLAGKRGRVVRLRVDSDEPRELVLSEIEVYPSRWVWR